VLLACHDLIKANAMWTTLWTKIYLVFTTLAKISNAERFTQKEIGAISNVWHTTNAMLIQKVWWPRWCADFPNIGAKQQPTMHFRALPRL